MQGLGDVTVHNYDAGHKLAERRHSFGCFQSFLDYFDYNTVAVEEDTGLANFAVGSIRLEATVALKFVALPIKVLVF